MSRIISTALASMAVLAAVVLVGASFMRHSTACALYVDDVDIARDDAVIAHMEPMKLDGTYHYCQSVRWASDHVGP